jgi:nucleotide-binding universal stress UspA family protein
VIVTSVAPVLVGSHEMGGIDPADSPEQHEAELASARAFLDGRGVTGEYQVAVGDAAAAIVELADQEKADLIVVGTRQPSLVSTLLGVSVSGAVKRKAHCDVLIVQ